MSEDWDQAVDRNRDVFRRHGFDSNDIDFSSVEPEAIEAMAQALLALERAPEWPPGIREWGMKLIVAARQANENIDSYRGAANAPIWEDELRIAILNRVGPPPKR